MSDMAASNLYCDEPADDHADDPTVHPSPKTITIDSSDVDVRRISTIFESELHHLPPTDYPHRYRNGSLEASARRDAIDWILKVHAHYRFIPVTASLCVNYFDRFLSTHTIQKGSAWTYQLLSIACLSLAAKMEETNVPLLIDFQLFEPRFVFEPRTIRRMELLVMAKLKWRLRVVTAFDFIEYFGKKLVNSFSQHILDCASNLILNSFRVIDFLDYRPSTIAASAVLFAAGEINDFVPDVVNQCQKQMQEHLMDMCPSSAPQSPVGVLDLAACMSCDSQKSESNQAEPN